MTIGLPTMAGMKTGFGNYLLAFAPGTMIDQDELASGSGDGLNNDMWMDFGCKTGMGKRTHKIGVADPDGDNQFIPTGNPMHDMMDLMANVGASAVYFQYTTSTCRFAAADSMMAAQMQSVR